MRRPRIDDELLRLVLITDGQGDPQRLERIVGAAIAGGVRCVQVREPKWSVRLLLDTCERLAPVLEEARGVLLVNDRVDVAAARFAHGAQLGFRSLPPAASRQVVGPDALLGYSAHDEEELSLAAAGDCDFVLLSPVWATTSKPGAPHLGTTLAAQLTARAGLPVVWLGGIDAEKVGELAAIPAAGRPVGVAVRSAVMAAEDPAGAAAALLAAVRAVLSS